MHTNFISHKKFHHIPFETCHFIPSTSPIFPDEARRSSDEVLFVSLRYDDGEICDMFYVNPSKCEACVQNIASAVSTKLEKYK